MLTFMAVDRAVWTVSQEWDSSWWHVKIRQNQNQLETGNKNCSYIFKLHYIILLWLNRLWDKFEMSDICTRLFSVLHCQIIVFWCKRWLWLNGLYFKVPQWLWNCTKADVSYCTALSLHQPGVTMQQGRVNLPRIKDCSHKVKSN